MIQRLFVDLWEGVKAGVGVVVEAPLFWFALGALCAWILTS